MSTEMNPEVIVRPPRAAAEGLRRGLSVAYSEKPLFCENPERPPFGPGAADQVWQDIYKSAVETSIREPILCRRLKDIIFNQHNPAAMLAKILARRVACHDLPETELYPIIYEVLESDPCLLAGASADISAITVRDPSTPNSLHVILNLKGFHSLQIHRVSHHLWKEGRVELAYTLSNLVSMILSVDIHPAAVIGSGVMLDHGTGIVIGETSVVEDDVSILQSVTLGGTGKERGDRHPKVRRGVMIGAGAKILGNIEIGSMCKVAAGSVVLKDVPPHTTVAGVPAKVVRRHLHNSAPALEMQQAI